MPESDTMCQDSIPLRPVFLIKITLPDKLYTLRGVGVNQLTPKSISAELD